MTSPVNNEGTPASEAIATPPPPIPIENHFSLSYDVYFDGYTENPIVSMKSYQLAIAYADDLFRMGAQRVEIEKRLSVIGDENDIIDPADFLEEDEDDDE